MLFLSALALVAFVVALKITPPTAVVQHSKDGVRTKIPPIAWLLAIMAVAFGLSEGTATDWSALHVTEVAGVDSTTGSLGLVAVSAFMVVIRLLGDRLVARFGRRAVVRFGGVCAAVGYGTVTLVSGLPLLLVGWALVGLGVGMIAPQVYAVAGHIGGGRVLAVVVTFGYAAFLAGPAIVGFLVNHLGLHHTMAVPAVLCAGIVAPRRHHAEERRRPVARSLSRPAGVENAFLTANIGSGLRKLARSTRRRHRCRMEDAAAPERSTPFWACMLQRVGTGNIRRGMSLSRVRSGALH